MNHDRSPRSPLTGSCFYGTFDQRRAIERWENVGWTLLHWTEVPSIMAVMENVIGDVVFIDDNGWAWKGPMFSKAEPVPLEQYPPGIPDECMAT
jgi:hypothetical protein